MNTDYKLTADDLFSIGIKQGPVIGIILKSIGDSIDSRIALNTISRIMANPDIEVTDHRYIKIKDYYLEQKKKQEVYVPTPKTFKIWGEDIIEKSAIEQMKVAMELPITVTGALMGDAHLGYGICIGGVLACDNAVIPNAVGVDIACRMKLTCFDDIGSIVIDDPDWRPLLRAALDESTYFGVGESHIDEFNDHPVMEATEWKEIKILSDLKDKARSQLGTSGSGNHFVEFGNYREINKSEMYGDLAILSHSGSRGTGAKVADHYKKIAIAKLPEKYYKYRDLAWLSLDSEEGQEYWISMNLMGRYASACHEIIHNRIIKKMRNTIDSDIKPSIAIENHHNFAWKETHNGKSVIVHRKGATPASKGELGVIPGSMASACFVVRGKGNEESLMSASHGAGRRMSRNEARSTFEWDDVNVLLKEKNVELISAGIDESPGSYKDIHEVMAKQTDLVDVIGMFRPRIVKMSADGKAED